VFVQAESDAQEKDKQLNDLLVRMSQYEQVSQFVSDCYRLFFSSGLCLCSLYWLAICVLSAFYSSHSL